MKIAIVHDYLNQFGGAERVITALHELWPEAPIYTSIFNEQKMPEIFRHMDIRVSWMQRLPFVFDLFKSYFFLYPLVFDQFDLSGYDVLLSSSSAYAKGIRKSPKQLHICYCYTPARFLWRYDDYVKRESIPQIFKTLLSFLLEPIKKWDLNNSNAVDFFIAISRAVADRIAKIYQRQSVIIYPPVDNDLFSVSNVDADYFLVVSRLSAYKRIDLVIEACNRLELPLKILGAGPDRLRLKQLAGPTIEFVGPVADRELVKYVTQCRALIFPGEEDFGIVPLEAMAAGRPVIAYRGGGALETMIDEVTGLFFDEPTSESLMLALKRFQFLAWDKRRLQAQAVKFDKAQFKQKMKAFVETKVKERGL
ncbi:glycosyltransferase [Candidatus Saganbacteria bacterium]|nr:glycosyltransferase [Candidatus Saganbacteria bacterium]